MRWKDFFYFHRGQRLGVLLLLILIVLTLILQILLSNRRSSQIVLQENDSLIRAFEAFRRGGEQLQPDTTIRPDRESAGKTLPTYRSGSEVGDPSSADERSMRSYPAYPVTVKLQPGETISLNESDTSRWKMIPGIGSSYASRIVKYRELLGGFVRKDQLLEVYGLDAELYGRISPYIAPDSLWSRLAVNSADFRELLRHPYLNYEQVQAIFNLRRKKGNIRSIRELAMLDVFTEEDLNRLEPYLEF
ncbi:MAG: competence protein ComEA [Proteiniphilum sp.]|jgi:DNA uptake protein ComE-like DNA-binding protein|nr:competence protein ComEA [Proteiniphilum sp.]